MTMFIFVLPSCHLFYHKIHFEKTIANNTITTKVSKIKNNGRNCLSKEITTIKDSLKDQLVFHEVVIYNCQGAYSYEVRRKKRKYDNRKKVVVATGNQSLKNYGYYVHIKTVQSFNKTPNRRDALSKCKTPILIMRGQFDGGKWGYTDEYLKLFKNHQLVIIPNAGHSVALEQPELYMNTIIKFLDK